MLKKIGSLSRAEIEGLFGTKVFLELWVKVNLTGGIMNLC